MAEQFLELVIKPLIWIGLIVIIFNLLLNRYKNLD